MVDLNSILRDLYMVFLILAMWELIFGHDLLFQPARVALVAITIILVLAVPFRRLTGAGQQQPPANRARRNQVLTSPLAQGLPRTEKHTTTGKIRQQIYCSSEMQGWRPAMEDAACINSFDNNPVLKDEWAMYGVFDGHGGQAVSKRIAAEMGGMFERVLSENFPNEKKVTAPMIKECLTQTFARMDATLRESNQNGEFNFVGSTSIVVVVSETMLVCANVGDSRALLCRDGVSISLSEDHKPEMPMEKLRIERAGGSVEQIGPCYRVDGWGLNLSRAFGDFHYKQRGDLKPNEQKVSAEPEIVIIELDQKKDTFIAMGCDGVFELLKNQDIIDILNVGVKRQDKIETVVEELLNECISPNLLVTQGKGGDNVSAILIKMYTDTINSTPNDESQPTTASDANGANPTDEAGMRKR